MGQKCYHFMNMKKADLTKYEARLVEEQTKLQEDLSNIGTFNTENSQWEAMPTQQDGPESDPIDLADRVEEYESRSEMVKTLSRRLTDIENALTKIPLGTYGVCEISGEKIEEARLDANPAARTCKHHINE